MRRQRLHRLHRATRCDPAYAGASEKALPRLCAVSSIENTVAMEAGGDDEYGGSPLQRVGNQEDFATWFKQAAEDIQRKCVD